MAMTSALVMISSVSAVMWRRSLPRMRGAAIIAHSEKCDLDSS
jgi:hypothetical protein